MKSSARALRGESDSATRLAQRSVCARRIAPTGRRKTPPPVPPGRRPSAAREVGGARIDLRGCGARPTASPAPRASIASTRQPPIRPAGSDARSRGGCPLTFRYTQTMRDETLQARAWFACMCPPMPDSAIRHAVVAGPDPGHLLTASHTFMRGPSHSTTLLCGGHVGRSLGLLGGLLGEVGLSNPPIRLCKLRAPVLGCLLIRRRGRLVSGQGTHRARHGS